jgi:hypothetical protein
MTSRARRTEAFGGQTRRLTLSPSERAPNHSGERTGDQPNARPVRRRPCEVATLRAGARDAITDTRHGAASRANVEWFLRRTGGSPTSTSVGVDLSLERVIFDADALGSRGPRESLRSSTDTGRHSHKKAPGAAALHTIEAPGAVGPLPQLGERASRTAADKPHMYWTIGLTLCGVAYIGCLVGVALLRR